MYQPKASSPQNSKAIIQAVDGNKTFPAEILAFFVTARTPEPVHDVSVIIKPYFPLSNNDAKHDHYRQFGAVAGLLFYDSTADMSIVAAS